MQVGPALVAAMSRKIGVDASRLIDPGWVKVLCSLFGARNLDRRHKADSISGSLRFVLSEVTDCADLNPKCALWMKHIAD